MRSVKRSLFAAVPGVLLISVLMLTSCGGKGSTPASEPSDPDPSSTRVDTTAEAFTDQTSCADLDNLKVGPIELADAAMAREMSPAAPDPAPGESYVRVTVSGDWHGRGAVSVHNKIHFVIITSTDEFVRHRLKIPPNEPEVGEGERITFTHYYRVRGTNGLTLVCATIDGNVPLRMQDAQPTT
jgi:hypothetical protein